MVLGKSSWGLPLFPRPREQQGVSSQWEPNLEFFPRPSEIIHATQNPEDLEWNGEPSIHSSTPKPR